VNEPPTITMQAPEGASLSRCVGPHGRFTQSAQSRDHLAGFAGTVSDDGAKIEACARCQYQFLANRPAIDGSARQICCPQRCAMIRSWLAVNPRAWRVLILACVPTMAHCTARERQTNPEGSNSFF